MNLHQQLYKKLFKLGDMYVSAHNKNVEKLNKAFILPVMKQLTAVHV